jgi:hypothetical protein
MELFGDERVAEAVTMAPKDRIEVMFTDVSDDTIEQQLSKAIQSASSASASSSSSSASKTNDKALIESVSSSLTRDTVRNVAVKYNTLTPAIQTQQHQQPASATSASPGTCICTAAGVDGLGEAYWLDADGNPYYLDSAGAHVYYDDEDLPYYLTGAGERMYVDADGLAVYRDEQGWYGKDEEGKRVEIEVAGDGEGIVLDGDNTMTDHDAAPTSTSASTSATDSASSSAPPVTLSALAGAVGADLWPGEGLSGHDQSQSNSAAIEQAATASTSMSSSSASAPKPDASTIILRASSTTASSSSAPLAPVDAAAALATSPGALRAVTSAETARIRGLLGLPGDAEPLGDVKDGGNASGSALSADIVSESVRNLLATGCTHNSTAAGSRPCYQCLILVDAPTLHGTWSMSQIVVIFIVILMIFDVKYSYIRIVPIPLYRFHRDIGIR